MLQTTVTVLTLAALLVSSAAVVLLTDPDVAEAQTADDRQRAKAAFRAAKKAFAAKEFNQAAELFKEAYDFDPKPGLLFNIGTALSEAGNFPEALQFLKRYLAEKPDAPNADAVEKSVAELQELVDAAGANVMIQAKTEGLQVFIDGETDVRCLTPCMVTLPIGPHSITVAGNDLEPEVREVELIGGSTETLTFDPKPMVKLGAFRIRTTMTQGEVRVDGSPVASIPMANPVDLSPGSYQVAVVREGEQVWAGTVNIEPDKTIELMAANPDDGKVDVMTITAIALGGAGIVSMGAGVIFGLSASDAESSLEDQLNSGKKPDAALIDSGESDALYANIFYGVGLVAIGTGAAIYFLDLGGSERPPAAEGAGTGVSFFAAPTRDGAAVSLGFGF